MSRTERTEDMRRRCACVLSPDFVSRRVAPLAGEPAGTECALDIVRLKGTRFTLRCTFPSGAVVYVKAYRGHLGRGLFATLRALWAAGFNDSGPIRVPEPLGFFEDDNIVVMRRACGEPLSAQLTGCPLEAATERVRAAARWLATLHSARIEDLEQEGRCERSKILKEADVLAEAAAARPGHASALLEFLQQVHELAQASSASARLAPTHGQFTPSTVFVDSHAVTAIDLDTVSLSDPAKDVATFVSKLRYRELFKTDGQPVRAARLASEFLDEYAGTASGHLDNLQYYLALYCLKEFSKSIASTGSSAPARERAERLCRAEVQRLVQEGAPARSLPDSRKQAGNSTADAIAAWSALCSAAPATGPLHEARDSDISVVQAKQTARLTLRLTAPSGSRLYAKWYPNNLGRRCSKVSAALAAAGFGGDSEFRVPEVAAVVPDRTILIMNAAPGIPVSALLEAGSSSAALRGCRSAARWLAALHRSGVRVGRPEHEWTSLKAFRVPERLIAACAEVPGQAGPFLEILYQLKHRVERLPEAPSLVQTHGSYRPKHVFVADGITTAIDLDRSLPADPAKDVAEFAADLRASGIDRQYDSRLSEAAADAFLEEYLSQAPELERRVGCYLASYLTLRLLKSVTASSATDRWWPARFELYREAIARLCRKN